MSLPDPSQPITDLPITDLAARATVRLIPTAYFKPPVLSPLADTPDQLSALETLEGLTSRRLRAQSQGMPDLDARELAFRARAEQLRTWGHTHVNAAFTYTRQTGNRFNTAERGAWYCAFDDLTAIEEVAFHRTRELTYIGVYDDEAEYQALLADFIGAYPDLRTVKPPPPCLTPAPETGYAAGQQLAWALRAEGYSGLIYPSLRKPGGHCFAAFEPQSVQNVRPGARWRLVWSGSPHYDVFAVT